ncbi:MAG: hypothetical protein ACK4NC_00010 [Candidatus Gracilibacteria bacterium]
MSIEPFVGSHRIQPGRPLSKAQKMKLKASYAKADKIRAESERVKQQEEIPMAEDLLNELENSFHEKSPGQESKPA